MAKKTLLSEYHRKRDFKKTREPKGKVESDPGERLTFVVQEHHASRLHWDFRLELEGVLKSWAVPKGPSLDPKDKRLAVETEDHPLEYGAFEGTIPQGEYGGGEVFLWDKGYWEPDEETGDPVKALKKGHLKFRLYGERLEGSFVLVRTNYNKSKKSWLLMKHKEDVKRAELIDPWPGFIPPQLPKLLDEPVSSDGPWIQEVKFDGYRIQAHVKDGIAKLFTRNGLDWSNKFPLLLRGIEELGVTSGVFDGEIVALDEEGRSHFQGLQGVIKSKDDSGLKYFAFDLLYLEGRDLRELPLLERKNFLKEVLKKAPPGIQYSEHFEESAKDFFSVSCQHELEGIISKLADSPYRSGRGESWVKTKCEKRQEFVITGFTNPKGGRPGIGALLLGYYEKGELLPAGKVGTGFSEKILRELKKRLQEIETESSRGVHQVEPVLVCEVSFTEWTKDGSVRHPVFLGLREDKAPREILKETSAEEAKVSISSPEKILYEKEGLTKGEVAEYYRSVGEVMLPYFRDRPLSLVRCPNGTGEKCFYQKHFTGEHSEFFFVDSVEGILELVQLNAFEIHAWNCQRDDLLHPDQIVMDFDPGPEVSWKEVIEGAFLLKSILDDLELESFVKLTGGKGLHVHVPILPLYDWDQVKAFSQSLALELVTMEPKKFVAKMNKSLRTRKIFVDYLRNGYGATAVAPYSLRARETSAIALPVSWDELRRIKDPQVYTMKKALRKIQTRKKDPWEGMLKLRQRIEILEPVVKKSA